MQAASGTAHRGAAGRRLTFAVVLTIAVVAIATWCHGLGRDGGPSPTPDAPAAAADARHGAATSVDATPNDAARVAAGERVVDPNDSAHSAPSTVHRLELRDAAGLAVRGALVTVYDEEGNRNAIAMSNDDGNVDLDSPILTERAVGWSIEASIPGRRITASLRAPTSAGSVVVDMGAVGTVRATWQSSFFTTGTLEIVSIDGDRAVFRADLGPGGATVQVAAGPQRYSLTATSWATRGTKETPAPGRQGDVVALEFDLRRCRVVGRLAGTSADDATPVSWTCLEGPSGGVLVVERDGTFDLGVARGDPCTLVLLRDVECAIVPLPSLDAERIDVGTIAMSPRPTLGTIETRTAIGSVLLDAPIVIALEAHDRRRLDAARRGALVRFRPIPGRGVEVLGAPGVDSVTLGMDTRDHVCEPPTLVVSGGGTFAVTAAQGSRLVVRDDGDYPVGLPKPLVLREVTTSREYEPAESTSGPSGQRTTFRGLRAGRYAIIANDADVVGVPIDVGTDSEQEVHVTLP